MPSCRALVTAPTAHGVHREDHRHADSRLRSRRFSKGSVAGQVLHVGSWHRGATAGAIWPHTSILAPLRPPLHPGPPASAPMSRGEIPANLRLRALHGGVQRVWAHHPGLALHWRVSKETTCAGRSLAPPWGTCSFYFFAKESCSSIFRSARAASATPPGTTAAARAVCTRATALPPPAPTSSAHAATLAGHRGRSTCGTTQAGCCCCCGCAAVSRCAGGSGARGTEAVAPVPGPFERGLCDPHLGSPSGLQLQLQLPPP